MWWEQQWLTRRIVLIRPSKALTFSVICYWTWKLFLNMIIWVLNKRWKMLSLCRRYERWQFRTPLLENTAYSPAVISLDLKTLPWLAVLTKAYSMKALYCHRGTNLTELVSSRRLSLRHFLFSHYTGEVHFLRQDRHANKKRDGV